MPSHQVPTYYIHTYYQDMGSREPTCMNRGWGGRRRRGKSNGAIYNRFVYVGAGEFSSVAVRSEFGGDGGGGLA